MLDLKFADVNTENESESINKLVQSQNKNKDNNVKFKNCLLTIF